MSTAFPYLRSLRKTDLIGLAELTGMKDFEDFKKPELEATLDRYLSTNQSKFYGMSKLEPYYRRIMNPPRGSPIKKEPKPEPSPKVALASTPSRNAPAKAEEESAGEESSESEESSRPSPSLPAETPIRAGLKFPSLPATPAEVADKIDRQTIRVRKSVSKAWNSYGMTERSHVLRSWMSSVTAIEYAIIAIELYGLGQDILPWKYLTFPAHEGLNTPSFAIKIPDLFVLLSASFWSPFFLWLATSLVIPSIFAYFINLRMKITQPASAAVSHAYGTRRATSNLPRGKPGMNVDPLVYNVSKALVSYLVYANRFNFCDVFDVSSVDRVASSVPGGLPGLLTGSAICTLGSLYEAILRK